MFGIERENRKKLRIQYRFHRKKNRKDEKIEKSSTENRGNRERENSEYACQYMSTHTSKHTIVM